MKNGIANSGFLETSLLHSQNFSFMENKCVEKVIFTLATNGSCCFSLITGVIDETDENEIDEKYYTTNNIHLLRVNTRNSTVRASKRSSAMLQDITHMKQFFKLFKGFTEVSSKHEMLMRWNKIQKMLLKCYRQPFTFQKSRCFLAFF